MAGTPKAQSKMDDAIASGGKGHGSAASSPLQLHRPLIPQSPPSPTLPTLLPPRGQPATMESFEATVQAMMQKLAEQAQKLDEQAKTIAQWEGHQMPEESAAPPQQFQFSPGAAEEEDDGGEDWTERQETKGPPPAPGILQPVEDPASSVESTCLDQVNLTGKAPPNPDTDPDDSSVDPAHVPLPPKSDRSVSRQPVYDEPRKLSGGSSRGGNLDCETVVVSVFKIVEPR